MGVAKQGHRDFRNTFLGVFFYLHKKLLTFIIYIMIDFFLCKRIQLSIYGICYCDFCKSVIPIREYTSHYSFIYKKKPIWASI